MSNKAKSVYVLSTGGTITMQKTTRGFANAAGHLEKAMSQIPELDNADMPSYTVQDFEQPVDSANMTPVLWQKIAEKIFANYANHDGFVILHGTDTMAYTASALSFMFEHLAKPIILTGAQLPLFETRSDARENLINAMLFASRYRIPEVCVYFNNRLFRGNRCKKMDATSFSAYGSPNFPVLGKVGTDILLRHHLLRHADAKDLSLQRLVPLAISVLRLFPGLSVNVLQNILQEPLQALVLETYGLGTAPEDNHFLDVIRQATARGVVIVNCSQCPTAKVKMSQYAAGTALLNAGVIAGGDITTEAAITKLIYLFSKGLSMDEIKQQFKIDLRGELSL